MTVAFTVQNVVGDNSSAHAFHVRSDNWTGRNILVQLVIKAAVRLVAVPRVVVHVTEGVRNNIVTEQAILAVLAFAYIHKSGNIIITKQCISLNVFIVGRHLPRIAASHGQETRLLRLTFS